MAVPTGNKWGGNQNGINFDATAKILLPKAASILMPQTDFSIIFEPKKKFFRKTLYFSRSRAPPLEGIFRKFRKPFIKSAFSCSTTWGRKIFTAKARFLPFLGGYSLGGYLKTTQKGLSPRGYVKKLWIFRKTPTKTASLSRNKWKANFREDTKKHPLSFLTLWGYVPWQLNKESKFHDCAMTSKERARRRCGEIPG